MSKSEERFNIKMRDKSLHTNLLILKALKDFRTIEKTIDYLYAFYSNASVNKGSRQSQLTDFIKDLEEIFAIFTPSTVKTKIAKWKDIGGFL